MNQDIEKVLVSEEEIKQVCKNLGEQISKEYEGKELVVVGLMKGALPFMMELIKYITIPCQIDFMHVSSYHGGTSSMEMVFKKDIETSITGKHVILIDDIVDTGKTAVKMVELLYHRHPASIEFACLLDKPEGREVDFKPKYIGTTIPKAFVVGFGLDYEEYYRNLPYIGVLKPSVYNK